MVLCVNLVRFCLWINRLLSLSRVLVVRCSLLLIIVVVWCCCVLLKLLVVVCC